MGLYRAILLPSVAGPRDFRGDVFRSSVCALAMFLSPCYPPFPPPLPWKEEGSRGRTAAGEAGSDARVFCTVFAGHIQPFLAVCSKARLPLLLTALHLNFIPFGPWLPLPCFSSPGRANLSCSIPSSLSLLLALPILDMSSLSLREPHRAWHTGVPFQALL